MAQIVDSSILLIFVLFQQMLRVEDLPIKKPRYNKIENIVAKVFNYMQIVLYCLVYPACIATVAWYSHHSYFYTAMSWQFLIGLNILQLVLLLYIVTGFSLLIKMYKFHRLEY